jgi:transcriptional regulator with XRE-family HTH domain
MDVSQALRRAIRSSGRSLREVGRLADVDPGMLSRFMREEADIRISNVDRLARGLGLELRPKTTRRSK